MQSRLSVLTVLFSLLAFAPCAAQPVDRAASSPNATPDTSTTTDPHPPKPVALQALSLNTLSVWVGGSFSEGTLIGNLQEARVRLIGLRYHRLLAPLPSERRLDGPILSYTADIYPVLLLSIPPNAVSLPPEGGDLGGKSEAPIHKQGLNTYGFGVSPAGLRLTYRVAERMQPFLAGSTGFAYFVESVPNHWGKHLNFMFDVGAGAQIVLTSNFILTVGYRYHHLSNGFRGQINPGIDAHLLHVGVSVSQ